ncbi:hypothetical protein J40TS1_47550 [Paenibacillus montaniterrae]|uniref:PylC N-terminal domain-containing protein n=1 Tax=Paenibacillus montaniterrae TaxID=429341 RepID=A0A919YYI7_9BACL|nr:ATP-grasp domain-containing protein [Paenibacillus montaniterrae]GIP19113.1 hypothetical protein J40TS1_47550 [Paenibacillus montaniterrae]
MTNILITSAANKVPLIECFKKLLGFSAKIFIADCADNNIAKYFADQFIKVVPLKDSVIEDYILLCRKYQIKYIIPTREEDLLFFSLYRDRLEIQGVYVLVSSVEAIRITNDKLKFYKVLNAENLPVIPTFLTTEQFHEKTRLVVKERFGAGSKKIFVNLDKEQAVQVSYQLENPIVQPYIVGKEYSVDVYITRKKQVKAVVVRERQLIVDGESQITKVLDHPSISGLISKAALLLGLEGHVMFQVFEDEHEMLWIIECNARIGGASTLSMYAGLDSINWWISECGGKNVAESPVVIKKIKQVRYKKDLLL